MKWGRESSGHMERWRAFNQREERMRDREKTNGWDEVKLVKKRIYEQERSSVISKNEEENERTLTMKGTSSIPLVFPRAKTSPVSLPRQGKLRSGTSPISSYLKRTLGAESRKSPSWRDWLRKETERTTTETHDSEPHHYLASRMEGIATFSRREEGKFGFTAPEEKGEEKCVLDEDNRIRENKSCDTSERVVEETREASTSLIHTFLIWELTKPIIGVQRMH